MAVKVNMHEAKSQLSQLVERVLSGEKVTIARAGVPMADLVPHQRGTVRFGLGREEEPLDSQVFDGTDEEINAMFYGTGE